MKSARLNQTGIATPSIAATLPVIASEARQSSALVGQYGLLRRCAPRNDGERKVVMRKYTARVSFTVPEGTKAKLKEQASLDGISMSELVRRITRDLGEGRSR